jgi:hypothetical protein
MIRRAGALLVMTAMLAGCAGASTPAPSGPDLPGWDGAGTPPPGLNTTPGPDIVEMLSIMVGDTARTYPANCAITEGTSIIVNGKDATGAATFSWVGKKMPEISGTIGGIAFSAPDLSASISFVSVHAWSFSGTDSSSGKPVSGSAICR